MTERPSLRALLTSARVVIGAAAAAAVVAGVVVAVGSPAPTLVRRAVDLVETPTPSDTVAVCAGAVLATGRIEGDASQLAVAARASVVSGSAEGDPAADSLRTAFASGTDGPLVLRMAPQEREPSSLAGTQASVVQAEDVSGFAASSCAAPRFETWLAAGATSTGASDLVVLANPGDVAATVRIGVFAQAGLTAPPGGDGVVIPARAQVVLPLAGLALGEFAPVLRIQAAGGPVTAHLQTSRTVTLEPVGVDVTGATAAPDTVQVIPGIVTPTAANPDIDGATTVRVRALAPSAAASATISVVAEGAATPAVTPAEVALEAGVPLDLDVPGLPAGAYTVRVEADGVPIVASVWVSSALSGERDFAWLAAAPAISAPALVAIAEAPAGTRTTLHVSAGEAAADVVLTPVAGGEPRMLSLGAGESAGVAVAPGVWMVEASAPVHAAAAYASATALAGHPVQPGPSASSAVRIVP